MIFMFLPEIPDAQTQTLILRWIHSAVILLSCIELFRSIHIIQNKQVMTVVYKAAMILLIFFAIRILATILDNSLYGVGWFSTATNVLFWIYVFLKARQLRRRLESEEVGVKGRDSVSRALDEIYEEMTEAKHKIEKVL